MSSFKMALHPLLLSFCLFVTLSRADQCPTGAIYNEMTNTCYVFVSAELPFVSAQRVCLSLSGQLTPINSAFENTLLTEFVSTKLTSSGFWTGGHYDQGQWTWADWSAISYTKWAAAEPSGTTGKCISVQAVGGKWQATDCGFSLPFVCSVPAGASTPQPVTTTSPVQPTLTSTQACDAPWSYLPLTNSCYYFFSTPKMFSLAESFCDNLGAHLVSIHSQNEFVYVQDLVSAWLPTTTVLWTGLNHLNGSWMYTDGSSPDYAWDNTKPYNSGMCVQLDRSATQKDLQWTAVSCGYDHYFMCKKPAKH